MFFINFSIQTVMSYHYISVEEEKFFQTQIDKNVDTVEDFKFRLFSSDSVLTYKTHRLIVIIAMHNNETPILPYWMNGIIRHSKSPWVQVPLMNRNALNGNTIIQNTQSATHKLFDENIVLMVVLWKSLALFKLPNDKCGSNVSYFRALAKCNYCQQITAYSNYHYQDCHNGCKC